MVSVKRSRTQLTVVIVVVLVAAAHFNRQLPALPASNRWNREHSCPQSLGPASGGDLSWNNAANWSGNAIPGSSDDVTIGNASSSPITVSGTDVDIHSLNSSNSIEVTDHQFSLESSSAVSAAFNVDNGATVAVTGGVLDLKGGGMSGGAFTVAAGAELDFGGTQDLPATSSVTGAGDVALGSGQDTISGIYHVTGNTSIAAIEDFTGSAVFGTLTLDGSGAEAEVDGDATVTNQLVWNSGAAVGGGGTLTVESNVSTTPNLLLMTSPGDIEPTWYLDGATLTNQGQADLDVDGSGINGARLILISGAQFLNAGTFTVQNAAGVSVIPSGPGTFDNTGTLALYATNNASFLVASGVTFNNSGTVDMQSGTLQFATYYTQTDGVTKLDGGTIVTSSPLDIEGGLLDGSGTITGGVNNAGATNPGFSPGLITISGDYTQQPSGQLSIELGTTPGTQYDQVDVGGNVTLAGALNVSDINAFTSTAGETFTIIKNDGSIPVSGTFAGLPEGAIVTVGGRQFQISYTGGDGNDVTLTDDPYVVTNTNDSGAGSLREAITEADANPGNTITFAIPGGPAAINLLSALPDLTGTITIQGPGADDVTVERSSARGPPSSAFSRSMVARLSIFRA